VNALLEVPDDMLIGRVEQYLDPEVQAEFDELLRRMVRDRYELVVALNALEERCFFARLGAQS